MIILNIIGARPQFMKYFPVSRVIQKYNSSVKDILIHTGQHYDYNMSRIFFNELGIKEPDHHLNVGSGTHATQTAQIVERTEKLLIEYNPDVIIIYGDTNSTLAGALAASKLHIPIAHIEAGLRSYNKKMPEEVNRILSDHVSTFLFCPSKRAVQNLQREGFESIHNDGNLVELHDVENPTHAWINNPVVVNSGDVMHDTILYARDIARNKSSILSDLKITAHEYSVLTLHRAENTDDRDRLSMMIEFVNDTGNGTPVIFPIHPRTRKVYESANVAFSPNIKITDPLGYFDLIYLLDNAKLLMTDSGGMQKEAFWLGIPCITLRQETEWTETIESGWNILYKDFSGNIPTPPEKPTPYGNGNAAEVIVQYLIHSLK
jgi:UDP-GlcNAc3NAcA epimerase